MLEGYALIFEKDCDFCHVFWGRLPVFEGNTDDIGNVGSTYNEAVFDRLLFEIAIGLGKKPKN
jgi:hypothetical protein